MLINIKVKTLDAQTHELSIDNEITVREFKDKVAEKTNISADQQRIIYCGRVMFDDKQLKEYDVDGKVVHVAERPPPSQRLPATDSSTSNANPPNERRGRGRAVNMRNSPLFRALDGMVVGTMAFPMAANANGQDAVNPFAASSSFCMNRITVARHMLDCANNIAAYLEEPTRGLNNPPLDILARGRWTMESTVVEVGITSDVPQSQQIVEMVQGAVQAALRRSGNTNVTLVQLPIVYSSNESESNTANAADGGDGGAEHAPTADNAAATSEAANSSATPASVIIEDVIDDDEDTPTNDQSDNNSTTTSPIANTSADDNNDNAARTRSTNEGTDNSRRRTGTPVLASVIEQMRNVQNRLNPFIQQYYELLQSEPTFEESDTAGRENAQRLFDRVSEAFHYMSHAQHAISDLMLDVSQNTPRFLTCRPILVEQSGYVSSNTFLTPAMIPAAIRQQTRNATNGNTISTAANTSASNTNITSTRNSNNDTPNTSLNDYVSGSTASNDANNSVVEDPVDEPVVWQPTINFGTANPSTDNRNNTNASNNNATAGRGNLQRQMARLLQDVVSAAPFDTEFHVHINTPNVVSVDVPIGVNSAGAANTNLNNNDTSTETSATTAATTTTNDSSNTNASTNSSSSSSSSSTANPARVTTATLPTTSTQTRSTSRPHVHFNNIPVLGMPTGWNGRVLPNNNVSSFDRFLPCNSHHIREHEAAANAASGGNASNSTASASLPANRNNPSMATIVTRRPFRNMNELIQHMRTPSSRIVGSTMTSSPRTGNNPTTAQPARPDFNFREALEMIGGPRIVGTTIPSSRRPANNSASAPPPPADFDFHEALEMMGGSPSSRTAGSTMTSSRRPGNNTASDPTHPPDFDIREALEMIGGSASSRTAGSTTTSIRPPQFDFREARELFGNAPYTGNPDFDKLYYVHHYLLKFLRNNIFEGQPVNDDTIPSAINRAIQWFGESLLFLPQYEKPEYDSGDSLFNILRSTLPLVFKLIKKNPVNLKEFGEKLKQICEQFRKRLYSVLFICIGQANAEIFWVQLMRLLCNSIQTNLHRTAVEFLTVYLTPTIPSTIDEADAQQFIVLRSTQASNADDLQVPMDTDVKMSEVATTSQPKVDDEPLPSVVPGTENWHRHFPNNWLPIIARDIQKQKDNPPEQPPFSDAYISGMSSKRRKLIQNSKAPTEMSALIADSIKKAIQSSEGVGTSANSVQAHAAESVAVAIAQDPAVQSSCTDALRTNVRERLKKDPDFESDKFPNSNKFINK